MPFGAPLQTSDSQQIKDCQCAVSTQFLSLLSRPHELKHPVPILMSASLATWHKTLLSGHKHTNRSCGKLSPVIWQARPSQYP